MRRLEARFHPPLASRGTYIVVGNVVWDGDAKGAPPRIEPAPSLSTERAPATILATLRHLVLMTGSKTFQRLQSLGSRYWSFVELKSHSPERAIVQDA